MFNDSLKIWILKDTNQWGSFWNYYANIQAAAAEEVG
jgi:hypothetical protein